MNLASEGTCPEGSFLTPSKPAALNIEDDNFISIEDAKTGNSIQSRETSFSSHTRTTDSAEGDEDSKASELEATSKTENNASKNTVI